MSCLLARLTQRPRSHAPAVLLEPAAALSFRRHPQGRPPAPFPAGGERCGRGDDAASLMLPVVPSVTDTAASGCHFPAPPRGECRALLAWRQPSLRTPLLAMHCRVVVIIRHHDSGACLHRQHRRSSTLLRAAEPSPASHDESYKGGMARAMLGIIRPGDGTLCVPISAS